jgi:transglutaminase-like putative cysteine protease
MKFEDLYRTSFYGMLFLAALLVNADAEYSYARLYPLTMAIAGAVAYTKVDRPRGRGLNRQLANGLAFAAFGLTILEFSIEESLLVLACGHLLIYLTLIQMFLPKTVADDWFLCLLGLMQVVVGCFLSQSDLVGTILLAWVLSALWVLSLFHLHREALRNESATWAAPVSVAVTTPGPVGHARPSSDPYPGLIDSAFLSAGLRVALTTMALGGVIFLVMPRDPTLGRNTRFTTASQHLTGFSEDVRLGQLGEILENEAIVMSVELFDTEDRSVRPPEGQEMLWRGFAMALYQDGHWTRQDTAEAPDLPRLDARPTDLRQRIKMEASDSDVLFGLRPIVGASGPRVLRFNSIDGSLYRVDRRNLVEYMAPVAVYRGAMEYEVRSAAGRPMTQPGEDYPKASRLERMLAVPGPIADRLMAVADPIVAAIPPEEVVRRARAMESFLRDSGQFHYTLRMDVVDPALDPIADFVLNRKRGHCEYFASALTMLLRTTGIPARMVNGFKGGDWNELVRVISVRQKHAHSWVEALVGRAEDGSPIWLTLDASPPAERDETVARVGGFWGTLRWLKDTVRYLWVFYVVGFNSDRQERVLYRPIRELFVFLYNALESGSQDLGRTLRGLASWLLDFPNVTSFFSIKGFVVSCFGMLVLVWVFFLFRGVWRRAGGRISGARQEDATRMAGVAFYRRLLQSLTRLGLDRAAAETPRQFARRASEFLAAEGTASDPALGDIPRQVVEAFYRVRFGHLDLPPDALSRLEARLDTLDAGLSSSRQ